MNDVINPTEDVGQKPPKGGFSDKARMAANEIYRTEKERNASMAQGSQFINNNIK